MVCDKDEKEDIYHFMLHCTAYNEERSHSTQLQQPYIESDEDVLGHFLFNTEDSAVPGDGKNSQKRPKQKHKKREIVGAVAKAKPLPNHLICLIYRNIKNKEDQIALQENLNLLENWGNTWGMRFNAAKCNIMRVSQTHDPLLFNYSLTGQVLEEVMDDKYLGGNSQ